MRSESRTHAHTNTRSSMKAKQFQESGTTERKDSGTTERASERTMASTGEPEEASEFLSELRVGNTDAVRKLLEAGKRVGKRDKFGLTPLHYAALYGRDQAIALILKSVGADVNIRSASRTTPLHHAARAGHDACVKALLAAGADPFAQDAAGWTCLAFAAHANRVSTMRLILEHVGAEAKGLADMPTFIGDTPLKLAASAGNLGAVVVLLEHNASLFFRPRFIPHTQLPPAPLPASSAADAAATTAPSSAESDTEFALAYLPVEPPLVVERAEKVLPERPGTMSVVAAQFAALLEPDAAAHVPPDVMLVPQEHKGEQSGVSAHRALLVARCPFFQQHFAHHSASTGEVEIIAVPHATHAALLLLKEWIYSGTISALLDHPPDSKGRRRPQIPPAKIADFVALLRVVMTTFKQPTSSSSSNTSRKEGDEEKDDDSSESPRELLAVAFANSISTESAAVLLPVMIEPEYRYDKTARELLALCVVHALTRPRTERAGALPLYRLIQDMPRAVLCACVGSLDVHTEAVFDPEACPGANTDAESLMPELAPACPEAVKREINNTNVLLGRAVLGRQMTAAHAEVLQHIVKTLYNDQSARWFRKPVDEKRDFAEGYYTLIKHPMDLGTLKKRYCGKSLPPTHPTLAAAINDGRRIWQNAFLYNQPESGVFVVAHKLAMRWETSVRNAAWPGRDDTAQPAQPLTQSEVNALAEMLSELAPTDVAPVLDMAGASQNNGAADIDLSKLPSRVLRKIEAYTAMHIPVCPVLATTTHHDHHAVAYCLAGWLLLSFFVWRASRARSECV